MRSAVRQPGMHPRGCVHVGIRCSHDDRHSGACGKAGNKDPVRIGVVSADDLLGDTCDQSGLTLAGVLVFVAEPIPVPHGICPGILLGINDEKVMLVRKLIHAGPCRVVENRLRPAMQHDND